MRKFMFMRSELFAFEVLMRTWFCAARLFKHCMFKSSRQGSRINIQSNRAIAEA